MVNNWQASFGQANYAHVAKVDEERCVREDPNEHERNTKTEQSWKAVREMLVLFAIFDLLVAVSNLWQAWSNLSEDQEMAFALALIGFCFLNDFALAVTMLFFLWDMEGQSEAYYLKELGIDHWQLLSRIASFNWYANVGSLFAWLAVRLATSKGNPGFIAFIIVVAILRAAKLLPIKKLLDVLEKLEDDCRKKPVLPGECGIEKLHTNFLKSDTARKHETMWNRCLCVSMTAIVVFLGSAAVVLIVSDSFESKQLGHGPPPGWHQRQTEDADTERRLTGCSSESSYTNGEYIWYCTDPNDDQPDKWCPPWENYVARHHVKHKGLHAVGNGGAGGLAAAGTGAAVGTAFGPEFAIPGAAIGLVVGSISGAGASYALSSEDDSCFHKSDIGIPHMAFHTLWCICH